MVCLNCKTEYNPPKRRRPNQKFCSGRCGYLFDRLPRVEKVCQECLHRFIPRTRPLNDLRPQNFCSRKCLYKSRRSRRKATPVFGTPDWGRTIRLSLDYRDWRTAVLKRHGRICQICGITKSASPKTFFDVDHIKPVAIFPHLVFDVDNARVLCRPCHRKTETWGNRVQLLKKTMPSPVPTFYLPQAPIVPVADESTARNASL
jgi:hypothetical protein